MKPRLLRSPEAVVIYPREGVVIEQPLIGCFVTAALYLGSAVVSLTKKWFFSIIWS